MNDVNSTHVETEGSFADIPPRLTVTTMKRRNSSVVCESFSRSFVMRMMRRKELKEEEEPEGRPVGSTAE